MVVFFTYLLIKNDLHIYKEEFGTFGTPCLFNTRF